VRCDRRPSRRRRIPVSVILRQAPRCVHEAASTALVTRLRKPLGRPFRLPLSLVGWASTLFFQRACGTDVFGRTCTDVRLGWRNVFSEPRRASPRGGRTGIFNRACKFSGERSLVVKNTLYNFLAVFLLYLTAGVVGPAATARERSRLSATQAEQVLTGGATGPHTNLPNSSRGIRVPCPCGMCAICCELNIAFHCPGRHSWKKRSAFSLFVEDKSASHGHARPVSRRLPADLQSPLLHSLRRAEPPWVLLFSYSGSLSSSAPICS